MKLTLGRAFGIILSLTWTVNAFASDSQLDTLLELYDKNAISDPAQAKIYAEKAIELSNARGEQHTYHLSLRNLADLYNDQLNDKSSAEILFKELEKSACAGEGFNSLDCRVALQRLETFYSDQNDYSSAEHFVRQLLTQDQIYGGKNSALALSSMTKIAYYQRRQGKELLANETCREVSSATESMTSNRESEERLFLMHYKEYCSEK